MMFMTLTFSEMKPEKQLQHSSRTDSSRKQREKTERQRPGERKRRRRERDGASAPSSPGPQGRPLFSRAKCWQQAGHYAPGLTGSGLVRQHHGQSEPVSHSAEGVHFTGHNADVEHHAPQRFIVPLPRIDMSA